MALPVMFDGDIGEIIEKMTPSEQMEMMKLLDAYKIVESVKKARSGFMDFVHLVWPHFVGDKFIAGRHHKIMAKKFEDIASGKLKRLIINMPPRHTKSEFASFLLPAWFMGQFPHKKIIESSHTGDKALEFGRKTRNLVASPQFGEIFPGVELRADSKAAGSWSTNKGGSYFAVGVGGAVAGYGADLMVIDDPHSEQDGKNLNTDAFDAAWDWYMTGPRQRLQPGGAIVVVMTRWSKRDITGRLLDYAAKNPNADQWEVIEFPAILPSGKPLWPEYWSLEELQKTKATIHPRFWAAQYQQEPTSSESAIIKKDWWRIWEKNDPPECEFVIQSWDTAFTVNTRSDYSACTTWGVFYKEDGKGRMAPNVILLDSFKEKMEFPELKEVAFKHYKEFNPDTLVVEAKASGNSLIQELRNMGIPVQEFIPVKGNDKIVRVNAVADLFASGVIWCPDTRWAHELIDETADFPNGEHDDLVDSMSCALARYRQGGFLRLPSDEEDEPISRRRAAYY
jgi:predicted phage terminase large subunit-like protein